MGVIRGFKNALKSCVDVQLWVSADTLKAQVRSLKEVNRDLFRTAPAPPAEEFAKALKRQDLQESDLPRLIRHYGCLCALFLGLTALQWYYVFYLLSKGAGTSAIVALCVSSLTLMMAFRYHYWRFLMQEKTLGLGIRVWLQRGFCTPRK